MSSIQQIMTLVDALSHAEKLDLNVLLATSLTKSGKGKSAPAPAPAAEGGAAVAVKPKRVISDEQKAKMKAGREAAKAIKDAAIAAGVEPPKKTKPVKAAKKTVTATATAPAAAAPAAAELTSDGDMKKMTIDGTEYYMDPHTNNLFTLESDGSLGTFTGRYQPGQEEEIDFDASE
jgi:hypothetical protein